MRYVWPEFEALRMKQRSESAILAFAFTCNALHDSSLDISTTHCAHLV
jgi:hypothetical protein